MSQPKNAEPVGKAKRDPSTNVSKTVGTAPVTRMALETLLILPNGKGKGQR
jgi:hypothetical protein